MSTMTTFAEAWEASFMRDGRIVLTFDAGESFRPGGDIVSADICGRGALTLTWTDGSTATLPDVREKLAKAVRMSPLTVYWTAGDVTLGADLRR